MHNVYFHRFVFCAIERCNQNLMNLKIGSAGLLKEEIEILDLISERQCGQGTECQTKMERHIISQAAFIFATGKNLDWN